MLLGRGEHGGTRLLSPRIVDLMGSNQLPGDADLQTFGQPMITASPLAGVGQALGMTVVLDPVRAGYATSAGELSWGGAASTVFWV